MTADSLAVTYSGQYLSPRTPAVARDSAWLPSICGERKEKGPRGESRPFVFVELFDSQRESAELLKSICQNLPE